MFMMVEMMLSVPLSFRAFQSISFLWSSVLPIHYKQEDLWSMVICNGVCVEGELNADNSPISILEIYFRGSYFVFIFA